MVRDNRGRFVKGHSGNPGGKSADKEQVRKLLLDAVMNELTPAKAANIARKLVTQCEQGNNYARDQLFRLLALFDDTINLNHHVDQSILDLLTKVWGAGNGGS